MVPLVPPEPFGRDPAARATPDPFARFLGNSDAVHHVRAFGARAASVDAPVLLTGESGTGKGLLARAIHEASRRARGPLVAVNCAGIPDTLFESVFFGHVRGAFTGAQQSHRGLFEQAHGGTLFLDEIGELPTALQAKLLTALEDGEVRRLGSERTVRVDARVIAATSVDLERAVREGSFRRDLYHRLLVLSLRLPALRERLEDLDLLAHHFLDRYTKRYGRPNRGFTPAALDRLHAYAWPGNVRELAHAIEAAVLACDAGPIRVRHLPTSIISPEPVAFAAEPLAITREERGRYSFYGSPAEERRRIEEALRRFRGNKTRAAEALGMARNTLRLKIRALGLNGENRSQ